MNSITQLPQDLDPRRFDALHDDPPAWRGVIETLARGHGGGVVRQATEGTVLVALLGSDRVIKLFPPFLRDHFEFECAMLELLHGRVSLPTPRLLATGERDGWPYLVETQLAGEPLTETWKLMNQRQRCALLAAIGALTAEVHALSPAPLAALAPPWHLFIAGQRRRCLERQQRTGLPTHLLALVPEFITGAIPAGPPVALTGEYTPFNLFTTDARLAAMFDFGDGLVGPREYDWLGPLCFLAAGDAARVSAYIEGYGAAIDDAMRLQLLRLLLLHRYSNLPAQIACDAWQESQSFEDLARRIWP